MLQAEEAVLALPRGMVAGTDGSGMGERGPAVGSSVAERVAGQPLQGRGRGREMMRPSVPSMYERVTSMPGIEESEF